MKIKDCITLNGTLEFSRGITEEELNEIVKILGLNPEKDTINLEVDDDLLEFEAEEELMKSLLGELKELVRWCGTQDLTLLPDSKIEYIGDLGLDEHGYYVLCGDVFVAMDDESYYTHKANTETLINELKRRGFTVGLPKETEKKADPNEKQIRFNVSIAVSVDAIFWNRIDPVEEAICNFEQGDPAWEDLVDEFRCYIAEQQGLDRDEWDAWLDKAPMNEIMLFAAADPDYGIQIDETDPYDRDTEVVIVPFVFYADRCIAHRNKQR